MESESDDDRRDERPSPSRLEAAPLAHVRAAWRSWLSALATDADAAMAAAMAYESLAPDARDAWLDTLVVDGGSLEVPALALYAPLLAVESDGSRRRRIEEAIASDPRGPGAAARDAGALRGVSADGMHACVIVAPVYLDFVQVLACRYTPNGGILSAELEPLRHSGDLVASARSAGRGRTDTARDRHRGAGPRDPGRQARPPRHARGAPLLRLFVRSGALLTDCGYKKAARCPSIGAAAPVRASSASSKSSAIPGR